MFLQREDHGRVCVIRLPERLTMAHAAAHRHAIRDVVDGGHSRLVMDMSGVEFVDSSGLSVLVSALKAARNADGDVVISGPTPAGSPCVSATIEASVRSTSSPPELLFLEHVPNLVFVDQQVGLSVAMELDGGFVVPLDPTP